MCCHAKMTFNKSHIRGICMVTKGHFITIKFFSGAARGQRQGHGGTYQLVGYPWATFLQLIV